MAGWTVQVLDAEQSTGRPSCALSCLFLLGQEELEQLNDDDPARVALDLEAMERLLHDPAALQPVVQAFIAAVFAIPMTEAEVREVRRG